MSHPETPQTEDHQVMQHMRLNVSVSVKGVKTTDATFTWDGPLDEATQERFFEASAQYFAAVDAAYPPPAVI